MAVMNRVAVLAIVMIVFSSLDVMQVRAQRSRPSEFDPPSVVQDSGAIDGWDIRGIEEALSSSKFADRQRAMWLLGENPEKTVKVVQQAKQSFVPEVVARAEWIEKAWQRGILLGEDDRGLTNEMAGSRLESLLEQGRFDVVLFALGVTVDERDSRKVKSEVADMLATRFPAISQRAVESQQLPDLVKIIDVVAEGRDLALCRLQLLQSMGADLKAEGLLPESAKDWDAIQQDEIMVLLLYQVGEIDEAIAQARQLETTGKKTKAA